MTHPSGALRPFRPVRPFLPSRTLLVSAVLTVLAGSAAAQSSSVTLFGVLDLSMRRVKTGDTSLTKMSTNGTTPSRFGLRGVESLGNGYAASFWLEGDVSADTGTGGSKLFGRRSTVALAGPLGELQFGRDTLGAYRDLVQFDAFAHTGVGGIGNLINVLSTTVTPAGSATASATDRARADNLVQYTLPATLGGVYGHLQWHPGEGGKGAGNGLRLGYKGFGLDIAGAVNNIDVNQGDLRIANVGATYDIGPVRLSGLYQQMRLDPVNVAAADIRQNTWQLGTTVKVSAAGAVRAAFTKTSNYARARQFAVGYLHDLSKRTALYATYAQVKNQNGTATFVVNDAPTITAPNTGLLKSSGVEFGLRHSF